MNLTMISASALKCWECRAKHKADGGIPDVTDPAQPACLTTAGKFGAEKVCPDSKAEHSPVCVKVIASKLLYI